MRTAPVAALAFALISAAAGVARANGAFPAGAQIVVQPGDPSHVVLRATFGVLTSRDAGATFDWICEDAANYGTGQDPGIAITGDGSIITGVFGGISAGHGDACNWTLDLTSTFLVDVTVDRSHPATAYTLGGKQSGGYFLWRSDDNAKSWTEASTLPDSFFPVTADVAPSDPQRLYVSGGYFMNNMSKASLARSDDGGAHWTILPLPPIDGEPSPYIAGIDPTDADVVFVRPFVEPAHLLVTRDGGATWLDALTVPGEMTAFAIAPDGHAVLAGGPDAGIHVATLTSGVDPVFTKRSDYRAGCLLWTTERLLACGDAMNDGTLLAESLDEGVTFTPKVAVACVRGPLDCPKSSTVVDKCATLWPDVATQIGRGTCPDAGATSSSSAASGGGGASSTHGSSSAAGGGGGEAPSTGDAGCGCRVAGDPAARGLGSWAALALLASSYARRRRACRSRPA